MKEKSTRRTNEDRTAEMRARLLASARALFVEHGYAETSTPQIANKAEVTRGAIYHHFEDKAALFRAVVEAEAQALGHEIDAGSRAADDPLMAGSRIFFRAMSVPGRARLLLVDGPGVLGWQAMAEIDAGGGRAALEAGLRTVVDAEPGTLTALATILSAGFDAAALQVAEGGDVAPFEAAFELLLGGLAGPTTTTGGLS